MIRNDISVEKIGEKRKCGKRENYSKGRPIKERKAIRWDAH